MRRKRYTSVASNSAAVKSVVASSILATGLICAAGSTFAYETGDLILRAGVASVQPDEDSSNLELNGADIPGTSAGVDNSEQLGLTVTYMLRPHVGLGVLAATPFEHDIKANGLGVDAGEAKQLPPTITLQYFPMDSASAFQPYVGIGINYTIFFSEDVDSELEAALGTKGDLELDDSLGLAAQIGADYAIDEHWVLNASVWYLDIDTDATFKFDNGSRVEADVDVDPWVYMLGLGYLF
ncbi:MAG: outer membrane beta-barrel protein [Porticoccaceae bacterium]|nr:outer membrane beta-barrel protein [Porticoccaceae bacterium]